MKLSKHQFKKIVKQYLFENEENADNKDKETKTTPDVIDFKVNDGNRDYNVSLVKDKEGVHKIYVDDELRSDIKELLHILKIAAHGFIHPETKEEVKGILMKILAKEPQFAGKDKSAVLAVIARKIEDVKGVQSYAKSYLKDIMDKG